MCRTPTFSSLQTPCLILPAKIFVPPCGSFAALFFFLASSFLVSHQPSSIFILHVGPLFQSPYLPRVSLVSPPSPVSTPSPPSLASPPSPISPVPQFPPIFPFYLQTTTHLITHITTSLQSAKHESRITYEQVNLLNLLELPLLSTEHYTTSELAYNQKIE